MSDPTHAGTPDTSDTHAAATGDSHASAVTGSHDAHGAAAHDAGHGAEPLGPIDWTAWLAGIVGVAAGLLVVAALALRPAG